MSSEILQIAAQYSFYSGCIICVFGIIGNFLNILVFTQLKLFRNNRSAFYLTVESISNFIDLPIYMSIMLFTSIYGDDLTGRSIIWCKFRYILTQTCALTTSYTICFAAIDQFFSTDYRFNLTQMCTFKLARYFTVALACFVIIHSIVFSFFFDIQPSVGCIISNPVWLQYATYFFYPVLGGFLPILIVFLFSFLAYQNVRRIIRRQIPIVRRRLDQQMTAMVLMRIVLFACLIAPYTIYRAYIINFPISRTKPLDYAIGQLVQSICVSLVILNYTMNFYIFLISSSRFRRQVKLVLVKKCWQPLKFLCCSNHNQIAPESRESCTVKI